MGPLLQTILAVGLLGALEGPAEPASARPWLMLPLFALPYLLGLAVGRAGLAGRFRLERRLARLLALAPLLVHALALTPCGWRLSVSALLGEEVSFYGWPGLGLLALFLPFALATLATIDARARLRPKGSGLRRSLRALELRMFAIAATPLVVFTLGSAAVGSSDAVRVRVEEVSLYGAGFTFVLLLAMTLALPPFLRRVFDNHPLPPGPTRGLLESVAQRARFRCRELLVWRTGGLIPNAAILGLWPGQRLVVFSDALLAQLDPRELAAVYAHEIGHARRHHVPIFLAWTGAFFLAADLASRAVDPSGGALALAVAGGVVVLWFLSFVQLSRRFELEADLFAIEVLGEGESLARALEAVGGDLRDVASLRHFSPARRAAFLRRAEADPEHARAFRLRLRAASVVALVAFALTGALELRGLLRDRAAESAIAAWRLGERAQALAAVEQLARGGRERQLAQVGGRGELEAALELEAGSFEDALAWLRLAQAAGRPGADAAADALEHLAAGRDEEAARALERAAPVWSERIGAWAAARAAR